MKTLLATLREEIRARWGPTTFQIIVYVVTFGVATWFAVQYGR